MTITQETPALGTDRSVPASPPAPSARRRSNGPLVLLDLLQSYVAETGDLLPRADPGLAERSYELLELTDELEIWAIHWPQGQGLELHDHGGSVGALWVVEGTLEEHYIRPEQSLGRRTIVSGGGAAFGPHYVHDVVNAQTAPATSVHAYSPPMESMTFYRREPHGLVAARAEYRADPTWAP